VRAPGAVSSAVGPSFDALDDAHITIGSVTECTECLLIPGTVMRRDGLRDAIKLEEDRALIQPTFIDARRQPAREETAPCRLKCGASEPGICSESFLVADRAVHGNPICFSHGLRAPSMLLACSSILVCAKDRIDPSLVTGSAGLKPLQHIRIDAK